MNEQDDPGKTIYSCQLVLNSNFTTETEKINNNLKIIKGINNSNKFEKYGEIHKISSLAAAKYLEKAANTTKSPVAKYRHIYQAVLLYYNYDKTKAHELAFIFISELSRYDSYGTDAFVVRCFLEGFEEKYLRMKKVCSLDEKLLIQSIYKLNNGVRKRRMIQRRTI
jgi:hypothetical protein